MHGTCPVSCSDHFLIYGCRKKKKIKADKKSIFARTYSKFNAANFLRDVELVDWNTVYACTYPNNAWETFKTHFVKLLDIHLPWKHMTFKTHSPPWLTHEFVSAVKERDHCDTYANRVKTLDALTEAHCVRNRVTALKRNLQHVYCTTAIENAGNNAKKL